MPPPSFLAGGGDIGAVLRAYDWTISELGDPEQWAGSLKTVVGLMLNSDQPMLVTWGESFVALHNGAYAALIGDDHRSGLARPLLDDRSDLSSQIEPLVRRAMAGEAIKTVNMVVPIARAGFQVKAHFSISFTPVQDNGRIGGVLCLPTETTDIIVAQRRKTTLLELSDRLRSLREPRDMVAAAVATLGQYLRANRVGYGEVQADDETIVLETSYVDGVEPLSGSFKLEGFGLDNIARQRLGMTVVHDDVRQAEHEDPDVWASIETRSFASVPLVRDGRLRASLYVNFRQPYAWRSEDIVLVEEVAARIWDALERARAEEALRASEARFRTAVEDLRKLNDQLNERIVEERALNAQMHEQGAALTRAQESLRTIFNASSEGLALCRLIRDDDGRVLDYQVLDVNPAHLVLCSVPRDQMLAKPVSQIAPPIDPRWMITAEKAVRTGEMQSFEVRNRFNGRWLDIHVSPVSGDLFAQTFIDVTARHEAEEQRARLIAEMNHRVMNNFQVVAGILGLQARRSQNSDVREQLTNAVRRVHLLAELHEKLAFAPETGDVDFAAYLRAVCDRLRGSIDEPDRVRLTLQAAPATLDAAVALPLGFIVNELVTNAIKYAFPASDEGDISVTFRQDGAAFLLRVADGGAGLPPGVEAKGTGLGMRLVSSFVDQISGTLDVRHLPGVEYVIRFPASRH